MNYAQALGETLKILREGKNMAATERMIEFARAIAEKLGLDEPDYDDYEDTSTFISENKDEYYNSLRGRD